MTIHPLVASVSRWLRFGRLYYGVELAGLSCGVGSDGLTIADWGIGGRLFERNE